VKSTPVVYESAILHKYTGFILTKGCLSFKQYQTAQTAQTPQKMKCKIEGKVLMKAVSVWKIQAIVSQ
jgi:hypothetical protein